MINKNDHITKNKQLDRVVNYEDGWSQITIGDQRFYKNSNKYYPSVTYILSCYPKGKWFEDWLKENGNNANNIASVAAEKGSNVHQAIEGMLEGNEPVWIADSGYANYSLEEWKMILRFADFWNTVKPKLVKSEFHIFSEKYIYAGTIDLILEIDGELWVLDIKTSNALHTTYELQVASYAVAWNEHFPDTPIKNTGILWLKSKTQKSSKERLQGPGWQIKTFDRQYNESFELFMKVYDIFRIENPDAEPVSNKYPNKIKLELV